ncbi:hypothetical protein NDU88_009429 [Pleurodeles waltl]|uniref:Uncharacterized protein n=1 Tax=Pleurodeles waltl TaxID=8319 RepID=A0AAV7RV73_PLEWA|nr:hypothetical protein NDU88_009429 [Pleurodeles waltl]
MHPLGERVDQEESRVRGGRYHLRPNPEQRQPSTITDLFTITLTDYITFTASQSGEASKDDKKTKSLPKMTDMGPKKHKKASSPGKKTPRMLCLSRPNKVAEGRKVCAAFFRVPEEAEMDDSATL